MIEFAKVKLGFYWSSFVEKKYQVSFATKHLTAYQICKWLYYNYFDEFGHHHKRLVDRLFSKGFKVNQLRNSFIKFIYGRYLDLITNYLGPFRITNAEVMICKIVYSMISKVDVLY